MIYVVWEFHVLPEKRAKFETAYKSDGIWAQLFRRDAAYLKTILIRDRDKAGSYLTIDVWKDRESYLGFKQHFASDYARIDAECEALTNSERLIGIFEEVV